jgi:hypothetical protein
LSTGDSSNHEQAIILEETFVTESASDSIQSLTAQAEGRIDQPPPYSSLAAPYSSLAAPYGHMGGLPDYLDIMQQSSREIATIFGAARETDVV